MSLKWNRAQPQGLLGLVSAPKGVCGVYVFRSLVAPAVLYVGSSQDLGVRFDQHRGDPPWDSDPLGRHHEAWFAEAQEGLILFIEAYLAQQLDPLYGERHPNVEPFPVNLPQFAALPASALGAWPAASFTLADHFRPENGHTNPARSAARGLT